MNRAMSGYLDIIAKEISPEGIAWGIRSPRTKEIVSDIIDRITTAIQAGAQETNGLSEALVNLADRRVKALTSQIG